MQPTAVLLREVSVTYPGEVRALREIELAVAEGEMVLLVGPTGHGKSTLLKLLYREVKPTSGQVIVFGEDVGRLKSRRVPALRRRLGIVFQDIRLLPRRTAEANIAFALRISGLDEKETRRRTAALLEQVGLAHRARALPHQLSVGEQQKIAIARAISCRPSLLLADEPTGDLDPESTREVADLLEQINQQGTTTIVATHDLELVSRLKARVVQLEHGRIAPNGTEEAIAKSESQAELSAP